MRKRWEEMKTKGKRADRGRKRRRKNNNGGGGGGDSDDVDDRP